jgi:uncharacterized protein (DUF2062 family)
MATTRETMTGHMEPITDVDRRAATRAVFLGIMLTVTLAPIFHASYELGIWLTETYLR